MKARTGDGSLSSRYAVLFLALAVLAAAVSFAVSSVANAQEQQERPGLLNRLFGSKPAYRIEDPPAEVAKPKAERTQRKKKPRVQRDGAEPPPIAVISKRPDARVVLVVGDFLGGGLAEGLTTALMESPNVRIVDRTSGSSGFVREDFHNWPERVDELITSERPAAVIIMIGANDRQQMLVDGVRETVRSENWNKEYAKRSEALAKAIADRKVPFLWVGVPSFKSSKMMLDMLAFNDIYRAAAGSAGGEFVDIWDGFVDENGAYMPTGPDINGQPARLRAADGINLARPGKRKVAFYAEKPLYKLLGEDPNASVAAAAATPARSPYRIMGPFGPVEPETPSDIDVVVDPNEVGPIDPARPVALRTPALDGGVELLGMVAEPRLEARTPAEKLAIEGIAPAPLAGRADQAAWPQFASAAAAMRLINIDRTVNKLVAPSVLPDPAEDAAEPRAVRSDVLTEPRPEAPLPAPPTIQPDRLEEISPTQAAPAIASAAPPMVTPATIDKMIVPDVAVGDPLDLSPSRGAPQQAFKRPKSIGPEGNRAPTAVPRKFEDVYAPAEAVPAEETPSIPSASNDGAVESEPLAEAKPATPDTAPARDAAPSIIPDVVDDLAPARAAPRKAAPVPVAALPAKDAPTELLPADEAPRTAAVPNAAVEPVQDVSVAKAVPSSVTPADITGSRPVKSSPLTEPAAPARAPVLTAPTAVPASIGGTVPAATEPATAAPSASSPAATTQGPAEATTSAPIAPSPDASVDTAAPQPATPSAPAAPSVLPGEAAPAASSEPETEAAAPAQTEAPDAVAAPPPAVQPATPAAPSAPTVLPDKTPAPSTPGTAAQATTPDEPAAPVAASPAAPSAPVTPPVSGEDVSSIKTVPAGAPATAQP